MAKKLIALICLATLASGCGQATEDAFNEQFDASFSSSCVSAATQGGMPVAIATEACNCALEGINDKYSATEKLTLSDELATPIMAACMEKVTLP